MNYNVLYLLSELAAPVIILAVCAVMWKKPPRFGEQIGYKTRSSQSSEEAWNFAQVYWARLSTYIFAAFTALTVIVGLVGIFVNFGDKIGFAVFIAQNVVLVGLLIVTIVSTEIKLHKFFDENGKPRG